MIVPVLVAATFKKNTSQYRFSNMELNGMSEDNSFRDRWRATRNTSEKKRFKAVGIYQRLGSMERKDSRVSLIARIHDR